MLKHWQFWFAIIGAICSSGTMFFAQRSDMDTRWEIMQAGLAAQRTVLAVTQTDIKYIREDVSEIKEALRDSNFDKIPERQTKDIRQALH